jgi:methylenetetrahydrofolate dehydrogenase (NADP+)/methenyltetrahydrofolate cyclohydrolase
MSISGKTISVSIYNNLKKDLVKLKNNNITPGLAILLVGNNPSSIVYTKMKEKKCKELGINSYYLHLDNNIEEHIVISKINELNNNNNIHGILIQLPLPSHLDSYKILNKIDINKDVDGFHTRNVGHLFLNNKPLFYPCTPLGCIEILKYHNIQIEGKNVVMIGASQIVGKPLAMMLLNLEATVTICHIKTKNLKEHTLKADIICVATGVPNLITKDMVNRDCVILDIGITKIEDKNNKKGYKLVGDCDYDNLLDYVKLITPGTGGVGPLTIAMLMKQTVKSAERNLTIT